METEGEETEDWLRAIAAGLETPPESAGQASAFSFIGLAPGDVLGERYRIVRRIGAGAMGAVFEAEQEALARHVAVKVMRAEVASDPRFRARFRREALAAARVKHPNVVDVLDFGVHRERPYLVMELLEGEPLRDYLHREAPLDLDPLRSLMGPVLKGIAAMHDEGVVHRDVKPDNVFLAREDGRVVPKVLDFGIAQLDEASRLTAAGGTIGTPAYMAPEQLEGTTDLGPAVDQYAAGTILFEALAGHLPFGPEGQPPLAAKTSFPPPSLRASRPDVPRGLEAAIRRAMSLDPSERFADVEALLARLEDPHAGASADRRPIVAAVVIALAAAAAGLLLIPSSPEADETPDVPVVAAPEEPPEPAPSPRAELAPSDAGAPEAAEPAPAIEPTPAPVAAARRRRRRRAEPPAEAPRPPEPDAPPAPEPDVSLGANDAPILH